MDGEFLKSYNSKEELKSDNWVYGSISRAIKEQRTYQNYQWICGEKKDILSKKSNNVTKRVAQYNFEGILVRIFESTKDAKAYFPNVGKVLRRQTE